MRMWNRSVPSPVAATWAQRRLPYPPATLPSASVFDHYLNNGTTISFNALPKKSGYQVLSDVVLSAGNNPFGAANPLGIYVIDCAGGKLKIEYARINATLVVINPSHQSRVEDSVHWEPAISNYPALLVKDGNLRLDTTTAVLDEAARGVNFNSPGSPYQGSTDADRTDTYPSQIKGIIYSSGKIYIGGTPTINGVLITGGDLPVYSGHSLTVTHDPQYITNAPPGFSLGETLKVVSGSWRRDVAP